VIASRRDADGTSIVTVDGELDLATAPELLRTVKLVLDENRPDRIVFDMSGLRFMDSSGISVLINAAAAGTVVEVRDPTPAVRRVLELTGLMSVLTIVP
jgi:anti-sigma B factor antagonist